MKIRGSYKETTAEEEEVDGYECDLWSDHQSGGKHNTDSEEDTDPEDNSQPDNNDYFVGIDVCLCNAMRRHAPCIMAFPMPRDEEGEQIYFHVISHCCLRYTEFRSTLHVDLTGDSSIEAATPTHVSSRVFFLPLRGLSLILPKPKVRLSQSISVAFHGGALLNISWNAPIICAINSNNAFEVNIATKLNHLLQ
ncbi:hypothetical protein C0J52_12423 [Blattella germanica]|nr:hypothetical protein C0J52_12423 [Blattella germanica]